MDTILQLSPAILALVPIVLGLTAVAKMYVDSRWAPLIALGFGIGGAFLVPAATIALTVLSGIVVGLTASGLYSGAKTTFAPPAPSLG